MNGIIRIYNRLPYKVEWQLDQIPYEIEAHTEAYVTYAVAQAAIKKSLYYLDFHDVEDWRFGIVPEQDPDFGSNLTKEDIAAVQPIEGVNYGLEFPVENYTKDKIAYVPGDMPQRRKRASRTVEITTSAEEGI